MRSKVKCGFLTQLYGPLTFWLFIFGLAESFSRTAHAQQWHSAHSIPVFRGTDAQDRVADARTSQMQCLARLGALSIALRMYMGDHMDQNPTNWQACQTYIEDPSTLICPASPFQLSETNWSTFDFAKASYTLFPFSLEDPESVAISCKHHGSYALADGGSYELKPYANFPVARNGDFYFPDHILSVLHRHSDVISCINNLKQIGFAIRVYSGDNGDSCPTNFSEIATNLGSPRVLFCPASGHLDIPTNFSQLDYSQISYTMNEILPTNPGDAPCVTCKYHGSFLRPDFSVQTGTNAYRYPGIILANPISQTVDPNATATLKLLTVYPSEMLSYQWRKQQPFDTNGEAWTNTVVISGATNASLILTNCTPADAGYYDVVVLLPSGLTETSAMAYLAVEPLTNVPFDASMAVLCCSNNLMHISIAARVQVDEQGFPSWGKGAYSFYFGWPMDLFCPSDSLRAPPENWDSFDLNNTSYVINTNLPPDATTNILARCKVHNSYVLADGQIVLTPPLRIEGLTPLNGTNIMTWAGGVAPFQVEMATDLTTTNWTTIAGPTFETSLVLPNTEQSAFFRVVGILDKEMQPTSTQKTSPTSPEHGFYFISTDIFSRQCAVQSPP